MKKLMMLFAGAVLASGAFSAELPAGYTAVEAIVATNGVIEVPAEGKHGFFYLMSKPAP